MIHCEHLTTLNPEVLKDALDNYIFPENPNFRPEKRCCTRCYRRFGFNFFCLQCKKRVCEDHIRIHCKKEDHKNLNFVLLFHTGDLYCLQCSKEIFPESYCKYRAMKFKQFHEISEYEDPTIRFSKENIQKFKIPNGLVPLASIGNTCYMNCLLQFFLHNCITIDWLTFHECSYQGDIPGCLMCELHKLLKKFYDPFRNYIPAPSDIFTVMLNKRPEFFETAHLMHDVQEVFNWIIQDIESQEDESSQNFAKIFYSTIKTFLQCEQCGIQKVHYEKWFNFSLLYPVGGSSMVECLSKFLEDFSVTSLTCNECDGKCHKISPSKFVSLPDIFVIAVSPSPNTSKKKASKTDFQIVLEKEIDVLGLVSTDFPQTPSEEDDEGISFPDFKKTPDYIATPESSSSASDDRDSGLGTENISPSSQDEEFQASPSSSSSINNEQQPDESPLYDQAITNTSYKLEGIIYYNAVENGGHYYAKVINHMSASKGRDDDEWIKCNDTEVAITSIDSPCSHQPYIFFYCITHDFCESMF